LVHCRAANGARSRLISAFLRPQGIQRRGAYVCARLCVERLRCESPESKQPHLELLAGLQRLSGGVSGRQFGTVQESVAPIDVLTEPSPERVVVVYPLARRRE